MSKWSSMYRDSRWQKLRLEIMERDGWACYICGDEGEGVMLNVHHKYYEPRKAPWEYPPETLVTLCEECHEDVTKAQKEYREAPSVMHPEVFVYYSRLVAEIARHMHAPVTLERLTEEQKQELIHGFLIAVEDATDEAIHRKQVSNGA